MELTSSWRKSVKSAQNGACVEVRFVHDTVEVRNSRDPFGSTLAFTPAEWAAFADGMAKGEFELPSA